MNELLITEGAEEDYAASLRFIFRKTPQDRWLIVAVAHTSRRPGYWVSR